jgi:hypothetical protein
VLERRGRVLRCGQRTGAISEILAIPAQATLLVGHRQFETDAREVDARGLLYLLDEVEGAMLERQCGLGFALAQIQFRLPHLVERGFERGSRGLVEQCRGFGDVVDVAVFGFDVPCVAEFRAFLRGLFRRSCAAASAPTCELASACPAPMAASA